MKTHTVLALGMILLVALIFIPLSPVIADPVKEWKDCDRFWEIMEKHKESNGSPPSGIEKKIEACKASGWHP